MPKCGSTSIHNTLGKVSDAKIIPIVDILNKNKYIFTFVRNPWSRVLSCWNGWIKNKPKSRLFNIEGIDKGMSFKDFVYVIKDISDKDADQHFVSLSYITEYNGKDILNFYGKIENINNDWKILKNKFNLNNIKHLAKTDIGKQIKKYYTDDMIDIINNRYKNDIIKFDYNVEKIIKNNG